MIKIEINNIRHNRWYVHIYLNNRHITKKDFDSINEAMDWIKEQTIIGIQMVNMLKAPVSEQLVQIGDIIQKM